jgi:hypothetical protein
MEYVNRTSTDFIAVHCSATPGARDIGRAEIRRWHMDKGWIDIGYHFVIRRNGRIEVGRPLDVRGAHVEGFNGKAVGICLVGGTDDTGKAENNFTAWQLSSLLDTLAFLKAYAPQARIQGHRDFPSVAKDCPSFDVRAWLASSAPELLTEAVPPARVTPAP